MSRHCGSCPNEVPADRNFCEACRPPECIFCGERGLHDCPGGKYVCEGARGQVFPGKVDANIFAERPCTCFGLCHCTHTWKALP